MTLRTIAWRSDEPFGTEHASVTIDGRGFSATGVAIGSDPLLYRLDYTVETGPDLVTRAVSVRAGGTGWSRSLLLRRAGDGVWSAEAASDGEVDLPAPGGELDRFAGALDPDLGRSPLFNTLPILRHGLQRGPGTQELLMVWISVPDLALHASPQRYTHVAGDATGATVRFEAIGPDDDFTADIRVDPDALVLDYPGLARSVS
jgi:hypothetical protein